jgi:hypothetical protein
MCKLFITIVLFFIATFGNAATLMVKVNFSGNEHQIADAWLVEQDLPSNFRLKGRNNDIKFDLLDENNKLISSSYANQPAPVYGAYILATEQEKQQLNERKLPRVKGSYYLRIPHYQINMNSIKLSYIPDIKLKSIDKTLATAISRRVTNKEYSLTKVQFK